MAYGLLFRTPAELRPEGGAVGARRGWLEKAQDTLRATALSTVILLGVLAGASGAEEPPAGRDRFELSLRTEVGLPRGYVQVRENEIQGTHLSFHSDLGIDTIERVTAGAAYRLSDVSRLRLAFDTIFLYGSARLDSDVFFNGATLQGGTDLQSRPEFFRLTALYERRLLDFAAGASVAGDIGLTYVFLTYKMHGTLSPLSQGGGGETMARASSIGSQVAGAGANPGGTPATVKEDFLTQELPIPMLGLTLDYPLGQHWSFASAVLGGFLPRVDSLRTEGGTVYLSQSHVDLSAVVRYRLSDCVDLDGGYAFHYYTQHESSHEDGNYIQLWDNDLLVAVHYRF
jgi:hypothetical protein